MIMADILKILLIIIGILTIYVSYWLLSEALFPALVGFLSARMPLGHVIGLFAGIAYAVMAVAAFLLPETRGKALKA